MFEHRTVQTIMLQHLHSRITDVLKLFPDTKHEEQKVTFHEFLQNFCSFRLCRLKKGTKWVFSSNVLIMSFFLFTCIPGKTGCPVGWIYFRSSCYYFSGESGSWDKARNFCKNKGADLVVMNSREEKVHCYFSLCLFWITSLLLLISFQQVNDEVKIKEMIST